MAFEIERVDCGLQGRQAEPVFGYVWRLQLHGVLCWKPGHVINPLRIKNWIICELEASLVLFYTGVSRESAKIISDQSNNVKAGEVDAIAAMHGLKNEALVMKKCLLKGDFEGLVDSMRVGWESKKRSAKTVSKSADWSIYNTAISAGALAGKVSGAGGGGFMMFFVPTEKRMSVVRNLGQFDDPGNSWGNEGVNRQ